MEPSKKRSRIHDLDIKELICSMQYRFFDKLRKIEEKIEQVASKYTLLENKIEAILYNIQGIPHETSLLSKPTTDNASSLISVSSNNIDDYPNGSWLGDSGDPNLRVRCDIAPEELKNLDMLCPTPEKMSLILLDLLFDRNVQACSNFSGTGKHGKKQLDPLKIFGIKCHLTYKFAISEEDWNRIRINIDSKCRTAFRRKLKGKPLCVRGLIPKSSCTLNKDDKPDQVIASSEFNCGILQNIEIVSGKVSPAALEIEESIASITSPVAIESFPAILPDKFDSQFIDTEHGTIQVIQATQEQFEQLKQNPHIEVLSET